MSNEEQAKQASEVARMELRIEELERRLAVTMREHAALVARRTIKVDAIIAPMGAFSRQEWFHLVEHARGVVCTEEASAQKELAELREEQRQEGMERDTLE